MGLFNEIAKEIVKETKKELAAENATESTTNTNGDGVVKTVERLKIHEHAKWSIKRKTKEGFEICSRTASISSNCITWTQEEKETATGIKTEPFKATIYFDELDAELFTRTDTLIRNRLMFPDSEAVLELDDRFWRAIEYVKRAADSEKKDRWMLMINRHIDRANGYVELITHINELHREQVLELQGRISILENDNIVTGNVVEKKKK